MIVSGAHSLAGAWKLKICHVLLHIHRQNN